MDYFQKLDKKLDTKKNFKFILNIMKGLTIEIAWHPSETLSGKNGPILSIDFHNSGVFVTGGIDGEIKVFFLY